MNQVAVLGYLIEGGPMTTSDIIDLYIKPPSHARNGMIARLNARLCSLKRYGFVEVIGTSRSGRGQNVKVWAVTADGRRYMEGTD